MFRRRSQVTTGPAMILPASTPVPGIPVPIPGRGTAADLIRGHGTQGQTPVPGIRVDRIVARGTVGEAIRGAGKFRGWYRHPSGSSNNCESGKPKGNPLFFCNL